MKITTLIENTQKNKSFFAEHGFSLYIETANHKLLSDCGCTDAFLANAKTLGIDLTAVDSVFLSHGHYDHSGGILPFTNINPTASVYMQKKALLPYYHKSSTQERYIGIDPAIAALPQLHLLEGDTLLDDELFLFTNVTGKILFSSSNLTLKKKVGTNFYQDTFDHEQYLVITEKDSRSADSPALRVLISGCAHNGIINILNHYYSLYHSYPNAVISGFHMQKKSEYLPEDIASIKETAARLSKLPTQFFTGHCTGELPFSIMKEIMGNRLTYLHSGDERMITSDIRRTYL